MGIALLLSKYGYVALLMILALDSSGVPWPTEVTLAAAGAAAQKGTLNIFLVGTSSLAGSAIGSSLSYYLGRRMGPTLMRRVTTFFRLSQETHDKVDQWFEKHGHNAVFFGRLVPFVRNFTGFPAGVMAMPFGKYMLYSLAGYALYITFALSLGYGGLAIFRWAAQFQLALWVIIPFAVLFAWFKWGRKLAARYRSRGQGQG